MRAITDAGWKAIEDALSADDDVVSAGTRYVMKSTYYNGVLRGIRVLHEIMVQQPDDYIDKMQNTALMENVIREGWNDHEDRARDNDLKMHVEQSSGLKRLFCSGAVMALADAEPIITREPYAVALSQLADMIEELFAYTDAIAIAGEDEPGVVRCTD